MIRRTLAACATALTLLLLGACSGGSGSDTPSPSAGASADSRGVPANAQPRTRAGGMHFVEFWVDTLNAATTSGDTKQLKTLAAKSCQLCKEFAGKLDTIYGAGGHVETQGFEVKSALPERGTPVGTTWIMSLVATPQTVYATKNAKAQQIRGGSLQVRMVLERKPGGWVVQELAAQ